MIKQRWVIVLLITGLTCMVYGCLRPSLTDEEIRVSVQAYLDAGPDPSDEHALTAEERAVIESFVVYRNKIKVQLFVGTEQSFWTPVGKKITHVFAYACREVNFLNNSYIGELYLNAEIDDQEDRFMIGKFTFNNSSERITTELFNPSRSRH